MAFPQTPLPVQVHIAPGADPAGDPGEWTWHEITDDVRVQDGIGTEAGRSDEAARVDPGKCTMSIDNRSGDYTPRNPLGQWYGSLSKNTPVQVRIERGADLFDRVSASGWGVSDSGQNWAHTGTSTWTVTGTVGRNLLAAANFANYAILQDANAYDVDLLYSASMQAVTTGGPWISAALVRYNGDKMYRVHTEFKPAGVITMKIALNVDGVNTTIIETAASTTYTAGQVIWSRVQADGPTIRARCWADGSPEPSTWLVSTDEATVSYGTGVGFYQWRHATNTNVGSLYIDVHSFYTTALMFTGTVAEWPVRWDQSGNDCVTSIEAAGILRRLQQGRSALRSPLYRQLTGYNPAGYWPFEDGSDSTAASSAAANGVAATAVGVEFASDDTLPGAGAVLKLTDAGSSIRGRVTRSTGTGFACMFLSRFATLPPAGKTTLVEWAGTGTVKTWRFSIDNAGVYLEGLAGDGTVLTGGVGPTYAANPTQWVAWQLEAVLVAGNVEWDFLWHQVGTQTFYVYSGAVAGSVGVITDFRLYGSASVAGAAFAHMYIGADTLPFVSTNFSLVSNGYAGELAADRVQRLCDEEGVRVSVEAGESAAMGRQRTATFLELLQVCEDSDLGVLYEQSTALAYRPHGARLNVVSDVTLDFDEGDIARPPEPTDDDQRVRNDITASRDDGGEARAADEAHIALVGRYDESVETNVETDDQLPDVAGWRLHLGTWDEMRWPRIALDLARNADRIGTAMALMRVGARITIANPPDQVGGDDLDLIVEGYTQTFGPYGWDVELSCSPARPWDVAVSDDTEVRADTDGSTLASGVTSTATALSVASATSTLWTTSVAEFPFDINLAGERCTVTAITGASSPQAFTVTRSVNGVVMAHSAGADVRLWSPSYASIL